MKKCLKCQNSFSVRVNIDGKIRNLNNRKFCLDCSPFGNHNRRDLSKNLNFKICPNCKNSKPIEDFYTRKDRINSVTSRCISCTKVLAKSYQHKTKNMAVEYLGGKCTYCDYNKYLGSLEFHHKDPKIKDFSISEHKIISWEKLKPELDKCILVCSNCHKEIHGGIIKVQE